jgi:hypothetical protein
MVNCSECDIEKKLEYCCMNHPLTEERTEIIISGIKYDACPQFNVDGACSVYNDLDFSSPCKGFDCGIIDQEDLEVKLK